MAQGKWDSLVKDVSVSTRESGGAKVEHLKQHERHQEIIRQRLLSCLSGASQPYLDAGTSAHQNLGSTIDGILDAIVDNATKDGLDLDGELLDSLSMMSANLFAIQLKWQEIHQLLNQSK